MLLEQKDDTDHVSTSMENEPQGKLSEQREGVYLGSETESVARM